jgi:myo-inositol-1(or 4)-monophosphatase
MSVENHFGEELETAELAAREAGQAIMSFYGKKYRIDEKKKGDPVTEADLEANSRIRKILLSRFPRDGWLSEEDKDGAERLNASRVWVVDPIDGTKEFIEETPQFSVSIGLVAEGKAVLGVVYNPAQGQLFRAARGAGATLNGLPIHVSQRERMEGALLLVSRSEPRLRFQPFADLCRVQPVGSIAYRLALVAGGEGDGTLTFRSVHEWDICAGAHIVEEAGGTVLDGAGRALAFNQREALFRGVVASNGSLARSLQEILAKALSEGSKA